MNQFDSPTEAALRQLEIESRSSSPATAIVQSVVGVGSKLLALCGEPGTAILGDLILTLKDLAVRKDEANLIYFGHALLDDIRRLYRKNDEMRKQVQEILTSTEFQETIANATLHVVRTNVEVRLKRLSHIVANGVRENNLEEESLDDMMRSASLLTENDIKVLQIVYEMQKDMLSPEILSKQRGERTNALQSKWQRWWGQNIKNYQGVTGLEFKNSSARLLAAGLVGPMPKSFSQSPTLDDLELLLNGIKFYEHLREIA